MSEENKPVTADLIPVPRKLLEELLSGSEYTENGIPMRKGDDYLCTYCHNHSVEPHEDDCAWAQIRKLLDGQAPDLCPTCNGHSRAEAGYACPNCGGSRRAEDSTTRNEGGR